MEHKKVKHGAKGYQFYELKLQCKEIFKDYLETRVFEIGAGTGAITQYFKNIVTCELNVNNHNRLRRFSEFVYTDFFSIDDSDLEQYNLIAGNLPYGLTAKIFNKIQPLRVKNYIFLIQKQVGDKLCCKKLSRLKVNMENRYKINKLLTINRIHFKPVPPVHGVFIKLEKRTMPHMIPYVNKKLSRIFMYKRKTLGRIYKLLDFKMVLFQSLRPEQLSYLKYLCLYFQYLVKHKPYRYMSLLNQVSR